MSRILWLFAMPAGWFALLGIVILVAQTPWGTRGGHVSNGLFLFILATLAAPIFGLAGCIHVYAMRRKAHYSTRMLIAAMVTSMCLVIGGIFVWAHTVNW
jgi:hypothetical protein